MCIHGLICTNRAIVELGFELKNKDRVVFDAVGGKVTAYLVRDEQDRVISVEIENIPSFVYNDAPFIIPFAGLGEVRTDIVFAAKL